MSNKQFDTLKWACLILLPAAAVLYSGLGGIWGLPFSEQIPATIDCIQIFLAACLGASTVKYNKKGDN